MERTSITNEGIVMNQLITRPKRRSRALVGSTMAMLVALPLGAALGMGTAAGAAVLPSTTTDTSSRTAGDKTEKTAESTLGDAVPWTADMAEDAAAQADAAEGFDAL